MAKIFATPTPDITASEQAHMDIVRARAGECMVLLENDGVLPIQAGGNIALYGNGARATVKGGTGSGDVNSRFVVNIEQGLEAAGFNVTTKPWLDAQQKAATEEKAAYMEGLQKKADEMGIDVMFLTLGNPFLPVALAPVTEADVAGSETDTAVYVLARNSGEGADRFDQPGDYQLLPAEIEALTVLGKSYKKVILLLNVGGVVDLSPVKAIPGVGAVVLISQSGNQGGHAVADLLVGKALPSGRLTDTWAAKYADYPSSATFSHNNGDIHEEDYSDGIFVGYRYFDTFGVAPLYPFGYGLGYTQFATAVDGVVADAVKVSVTATVTNTGSKFAGRDVVQVYASAPAGKLEKPYQVLVGFGKTKLLQPGESQTLTITFPLRNLESYDPAAAAYVLEAGTYYIRVGSHSRATKVAAAIALDADAVTKKVRNICPLDRPLEELSAAGATPYAYPEEATEKAAAPVLAVKAADVPTETVTYAGVPEPLAAPAADHPITVDEVKAGKYTLEDLVAQLTVPEMAVLCTGIARDKASEGSVIGMGSQSVPGAAGETTPSLVGRGILNTVNADGPAGLRLTPHFRTDAAGNILPGGAVFGDIKSEMPEKKEGEVDYYQYCTAIPIASLLASSWDMELIEEMGNVAGEELVQFGVSVWLAPGMNIHRNPLCGRNFEYYSEDPLLSGLCAAADVRGVQRNPGVGTSIKHFAVNNQEDNRMYVNEHVGERALREIYLRNFAVAIAASQPMTIMTSYNLINGIHAANNYDTITAYAREENGFAGYVMTDWYTSHPVISAALSAPGNTYPCSSSPECVRAGNDIQMPGCEGNIEDIIKAVEDGSLPIGYLQQCSLRMIRTILKKSVYEGVGPYAADLKLDPIVTVQ